MGPSAFAIHEARLVEQSCCVAGEVVDELALDKPLAGHPAAHDDALLADDGGVYLLRLQLGAVRTAAHSEGHLHARSDVLAVPLAEPPFHNLYRLVRLAPAMLRHAGGRACQRSDI